MEKKQKKEIRNEQFHLKIACLELYFFHLQNRFFPPNSSFSISFTLLGHTKKFQAFHF